MTYNYTDERSFSKLKRIVKTRGFDNIVHKVELISNIDAFNQFSRIKSKKKKMNY